MSKGKLVSTTKTMELTFTRTIPAPPAEVFAAWMDPKHPGHPWIGAKKLLFDGRVDGLFYFLHVTDDGVPLPHYGRFISIERDRSVQCGWMSPFTDGRESVVTVTFEKKGGDTLLTLTHADLPDSEEGRLHDDGWKECLGKFGESFPAGRAR
ncbi:MAG TPA: SRPBCC domain-containing protein [Polyangia bacterium]|nr:SRPBCC domain-containing protein [Polyangia bacterium]